MQCWTVRDTVYPGIALEYVVEDGDSAEQRQIAIRVGKDFIPLCRPMQKMVESALKQGIYKDPTEVVLSKIQFSNDHRFLVQETAKTDTALVLVQAQCGIGGKVYFNAETFRSQLKNGRVCKRYDPLDQAVGVKVELTSDGSDGPEMLALMRPGASFRVVRTGDIDDAPPVLIIQYTGTKVLLKTFGKNKRRRMTSLRPLAN